MKSVSFCTLGCKVNQYETDAMEEMFRNSGYEIRDFRDEADVYVINTCSVTNMADRKSRQMIHRAKKKNPSAIIVGTGCYIQASEADVLKDSMDIIVGNNCKNEIVSLVENFWNEREKEKKIININEPCDYEEMSISRVSEHTRAYIKIQDGCNQFCSYCIIPYTRGRIRSRKKQDILEEVQTLATSGYKEIVLTGIHLSSYGKDFNEQDALIRLIESLAAIEGIERIRFGSLEPRIITEDFVERLSNIPQVCPHFHLSLQSGCESTLKRMNRHYTPKEYLEKCDLIRKYFKYPAFTTDVIVGFPGETEEEFLECREFLEKVHFSEMHIFKYSPRKGTKAAGMPDQISEQIKTIRSGELLKLNDKMAKDYHALLKEQVFEVLIEEETEYEGEIYWVGHSKEYVKCLIKSDTLESNRIVKCRIIADNHQDFVFCERID